MCIDLILSSVDNRNVPWHIWQLTPLLFILHTKGIVLYPKWKNISQALLRTKKGSNMFLWVQADPSIGHGDLAQVFSSGGLAQVLSIWSSNIVWFCFASLLFVYQRLSTLTCMPLFFVKPKKYFCCKMIFRDLPSCWAGSSLSLSLAGLCKWGEDASRDNVWSVECQVKLFEKEQQHKKYFGEVSKNDNRG